MSYNQDLSQHLAEKIIKNTWDNGRLAPSYLFLGPKGTGRLYLARSLAKTVNCEVGSFPPCLACPSCKRIESNNHPDVHYIQKQNASFIKIEQIQQMQEEISLRPFEGRGKVFIILNAEDLTPEAANSLLKILEEPPPGSLIILIASDLRRMFPTIISRCQEIRFNPQDPHEAEVMLNREYDLDKDLSHYLAFIFEGRVEEALKFKDSNILYEKNRIIGYFFTRRYQANARADEFDSQNREELNWILKVLISCVRDLYFLKIGIDRVELINQDITDQLYPIAKKISFVDLYRMLQELSDSLELIRQNINPRLLIDNLRLWIS